MSGWQLIETAPKDGTRIVLSCWDDYNKTWVFRVDHWRLYVAEGEGWGWERHPSHWMLLPEPPK
jgi:hypothetical protein